MMIKNPTAVRFLHHLISGEAFYSGLFCLLVAIAARHYRWRGGERTVWIFTALGGLLIYLSATPLANGYVLPVLITVGWLIFAAPSGKDAAASPVLDKSQRRPVRKFELWLGFAVALLWLIEGVQELGWHQPPVLKFPHPAHVVVLGDSLSADHATPDVLVTWPKLLGDQCKCEVLNLSQPGVTVARALKHLPKTYPEEALTIVELGGNDLLGKTSSVQFEAQLDALLKEVTSHSRETLMFELPLPVQGNGYGAAQRRLARKYKVQLIPKSVLAGLLISPATTIDTIHMNAYGHYLLAERIGKIVCGK